jgi:CBS domain-containing protein
MLTVRDLPPRPLVAVEPSARLAAVAARMRVEDADAVAVMSEAGLVGILTERDLVGAIADGVDAREATAAMIMSVDPASVRLGEDVRVVAVRMVALGIRHLPVVDDEGAPIGLLSARDLIRILDAETRPS